MKNKKFSAELNEAQSIYLSLISDYEALQDTAKLRRKYVRYMQILLISFMVFVGLYSVLYPSAETTSNFFLVLGIISLVIFVRVASKANKYIMSSNKQVIFNLCEGYEKLETFMKRGSGWYLDDAFKAIKRAYLTIARGKKGESSWDPPKQFYEQLGILEETMRRKILANISKETSNEQNQQILLESMKLADVMIKPSVEKIKKFVDDLRENEVLPEREYVTPSRRMMGALKDYPILWEFLKGSSLFGLSALIVVSFSLLLAQWLTFDLRDYVGYVIGATIALFIAFYFKKG